MVRVSLEGETEEAMREGSNKEHIADMTWPSPLLTNLSLKFTMTPDTNFSQAEIASSLCLELSLMVWPLNSKVQSPEGSSQDISAIFSDKKKEERMEDLILIRLRISQSLKYRNSRI